MMKSVSQRIAFVVAAVLICSALLQLAVVGWIVNRETVVIREGLMTLGLRLLRIAAEGVPLSKERLRAEFGDQAQTALALYDDRGRVTARSRDDVKSPNRLPYEQRKAAEKKPHRPVWLEPYSVRHDNAAIIRVKGDGPIRYVALVDRWAPARVKKAVRLGVLGGAVTSVLVGLVATLLLARRIRGKLRSAEDAMDRITTGELSARLPDYGDNELGRLSRLFNRMADRVQRHVRRIEEEETRRRQSFADWTHELSTPLTSVIAHLESLQMEGFDETVRRQYIETAYERALALKALSDDLATLSQLDFEGLSLDWGPVDPAELARTETEALRVQAGEAGVSLEVDTSGGEGLEIPGDRQRLGQVLRNILVNAVRHTDSGRTVFIRVDQPDDRHVRLEVCDQGSGIAPEHLHRLGQPFYRVDSSRSRKTGGRGLGLAIARGITEAHCGTLSVTSTVKEGTTVRVDLLKKPDTPPERP